MVKARRDEIVSESGAVSANRAHAALSSFYAWAIDKEHHTGANPTADIKPLKESKHSRVLSETELAEIWLKSLTASAIIAHRKGRGGGWRAGIG
jgi:site-specific recombinase XerD